MNDKETPLPLVRMLRKMIPGAYEELDQYLQKKIAGERWWPDVCPIPIEAAGDILIRHLTEKEGLAYDEAMRNSALGAAELTACWAWRKDKVVYSFDHDLTELLTKQADDMNNEDILPSELLFHPPFPCIYIKAPEAFEPGEVDGFFYWVEYDPKTNDYEARFQFMDRSMEVSFPRMMHIIPGKTIWDCAYDTIKRARVNAEEAPVIPITRVQNYMLPELRALQLVLYLCSDNRDIEESHTPVIHGKSQKRKNEDKAGLTLQYNVGVRVGAAIRRVQSTSASGAAAQSGLSKRPHARRGHWHHYWVGPKTDRHITLKWVAPTYIHLNDLQDEITVHPVK